MHSIQAEHCRVVIDGGNDTTKCLHKDSIYKQHQPLKEIKNEKVSSLGLPLQSVRFIIFNPCDFDSHPSMGKFPIIRLTRLSSAKCLKTRRGTHISVDQHIGVAGSYCPLKGCVIIDARKELC